MARTVILGTDNSLGYAPDQISTAVTLADLLEAVQNAIEDFGDDAVVITMDNARYGANFGALQTINGTEIQITDANPDED